MANQAEKWQDMKGPVDKLVKAYGDIPSPPRPDDSWSEKVNNLHRAVEGMSEALSGRIEQEQTMEDLAE
jgi:hypothetical protein